MPHLSHGHSLHHPPTNRIKTDVPRSFIKKRPTRPGDRATNLGFQEIRFDRFTTETSLAMFNPLRASHKDLRCSTDHIDLPKRKKKKTATVSLPNTI